MLHRRMVMELKRAAYGKCQSMHLSNTLIPLSPDVARWRHAIHQHPELAFEEHRTAEMVAALLRTFGVDEVVEGIGTTGVVGVIRTGDGPMIGLRADMDGLPIHELNDLPYRSQVEGTMHACGHDGHTAMLLAAAQHLAATRHFKGSVALVFQPAEEGKAGARKMLDDGLIERFPIREIYGLHNIPGLPAGSLSLSPGPVMAAADRFRIVVRGVGGHAAVPHATRDPVVAACALVTSAQTIVSRNAPPDETLVISFAEIHGGDAFNIIPEEVRLAGTLRFFNPAMGVLARERLGQMIAGIASAYNVEAEFTYLPGYPPTVNWAESVNFARGVAETVVGENHVMAQHPRMLAEDFSYFLQKIPGAYAFLGNGSAGETGSTGLHNAHYNFNDAILPVGASFLARIVEQALPL